LWLLFLLLPITLVLLISAVSEGDPPYFHYTTVSWEQVLPRPAEYTALPAYDATRGFDWYDGGWDRQGRYFASYAADRPYWPKGDPRLGPSNPLPTHIVRYRIVGVPQWTPMASLLVFWAAWLVPFTRHHISQLPRGGRGFDPLPNPRVANRPTAAATTAAPRG
jgi:hypothetical protein